MGKVEKIRNRAVPDGRAKMAISPTRRAFTVEEYHRMAQVGILGEDDRVELLEGEIVEMNPIGSNPAVLRHGTAEC